MSYTVEFIRDLQTKIIIDEKVPRAYAAILVENALYRFDERVQEGVSQWVKGELTEEFTVEDISLADIQYEIGGSLFQALCVMDIYLKNNTFIPMASWFERRDRINAE